MSAYRIVLCRQPVSDVVASGLDAFTLALKEKGIPYTVTHALSLDAPGDTALFVAGTAQDPAVRLSLQENGARTPAAPESLAFVRCRSRHGEYFLLAGADDVGLMYLLYEMARRIRAKGASALDSAVSYWESPENRVRCMDRYLLGHLDNEWFLSERFHDYFFDRLARNRFNRFNLMLGFDTAYMSPPYPFFVEVPGFEDVRLSGRVKTGREENLRALRAMVDACHRRGIRFVLATWQQRPWTAGQDTLVENLPPSEEGLSGYCHAGILALLKAAPGIDVVQFRVNHESGVGTQVSAETFWKRCIDAVAEAKRDTGRNFVLDLRAKGLTEEMVDHARLLGLDVEVPTKYWCEHAALPYHLSVMRSEELAQLDNFNHSRRYSYADMLRKPLKYDVIFRLWNYGSTNLFLWGDADYARRFSKSCTLSGAAGYQVNAPLSLKYGHELSHLAPWKIYRAEAFNQAAWEDERFWLWYVLFGRLGYNSACSADVWEDEFAGRFGEETGKLFLRALEVSSRIIPLITAVHMPVHPSLRYWTEMSTGWALFPENNLNQAAAYDFSKQITYGSSEPSDHGLFYGIDEFAEDVSAGAEMKGKYTPLQYAGWLESMSRSVHALLAPLRKSGGGQTEVQMGCVDMEMVALLGLYHAHKIRAAFELAMFRACRDAGRLLNSHHEMSGALLEWRALASLGKETYYHDLDFSSAGSTTRRGTWEDLTAELERDLSTLEGLLRGSGAEKQEKKAADRASEPQGCMILSAEIPQRAPAQKDLVIRAFAGGAEAFSPDLVLHYRHVNQLEGEFRTVPMVRSGREYRAVIPGQYVQADWDLMVYVTSQKKGGDCHMYPGVYHPAYPYPYAVIKTDRAEERWLS